MPRPLLEELVNASWRASAAAVVGELPMQPFGRRVVRIAIQGPQGSTLRIYRGRTINPVYLVSSVVPAADRLYDSQTGSAPMSLSAGEVYTFAWTGGSSGVGVTAQAVTASEVL